jgi:hypothetical protein
MINYVGSDYKFVNQKQFMDFKLFMLIKKLKLKELLIRFMLIIVLMVYHSPVINNVKLSKLIMDF